MLAVLSLSAGSRVTAGVLLLAIVTIEYGGIFMLKLVRGGVPATEFQRSFFRAGHAHAGVLVILALVAQVLVDAAEMSGWTESVARDAIPIAAILVPAGFFLSAAGRGVTTPNRLVMLLYAGIGLLGVGAIALGIGLVTA